MRSRIQIGRKIWQHTPGEGVVGDCVFWHGRVRGYSPMTRTVVSDLMRLWSSHFQTTRFSLS